MRAGWLSCLLAAGAVLLSGCGFNCDRLEPRLVSARVCSSWSGTHCSAYTTQMETQQVCVRDPGRESRRSKDAAGGRKKMDGTSVGLPDLAEFRRLLYETPGGAGLAYEKVDVEFYGAGKTFDAFWSPRARDLLDKESMAAEVSSRQSHSFYETPVHNRHAWVYKMKTARAAREVFEASQSDAPSQGYVGVAVDLHPPAGSAAAVYDLRDPRGFQRSLLIVVGPYFVYVSEHRSPHAQPSRIGQDPLVPPKPFDVEPVAKHVLSAFPKS